MARVFASLYEEEMKEAWLALLQETVARFSLAVMASSRFLTSVVTVTVTASTEGTVRVKSEIDLARALDGATWKLTRGAKEKAPTPAASKS